METTFYGAWKILPWTIVPNLFDIKMTKLDRASLSS